MPLIEHDLLNPSAASEATKHKKKRLIQSPNSTFLEIKCDGCMAITTVFRPNRAQIEFGSHAQTVVMCEGCSTLLCQPTGGKCHITAGCFVRNKA